MKKMMMVLAVTMGTLSAVVAWAAGYFTNGADSISMTVKALYLGKYQGGRCVFSTPVFDNSNATATDFTQRLDLGSGDATNGDFDCVALRVRNWLGVSPNSTSTGLCSGWTGQMLTIGATPHDLDGNVIGSPTNTTDIYLFFRNGASASGDPFDPAAGGALSVSGGAVHITDASTTLNFKFVAGTAGKTIRDLKDTGTECTFGDDAVSFQITQE